jgi:threonine aldolase
MGNLAALLSFAGRGEEVILEENAHIRSSETGGAACVGGLMLRGVYGPEGVPEPDAIERAARPDDIHYPRTALICLENTHYRYGGLASGPGRLEGVRKVAEKLGVPVHLDGARLFNASVALGLEAAELARHADSVMVSLSKGLGAPVGSVLCGPSDFMKRARRYRKMLGGGMRQTGWLASCGLIALSDESIARLGRDHRNAKLLAEGLALLPGFSVDLARTHTNFVIARVDRPGADAKRILAAMESRGVLATEAGEKTLRFVTSSRVEEQDVRYAIEVMGELARRREA